MKKHLKDMLCAAVLATTAFSASSALAAYPEKPIRLVIPYAPGGLSDSTARAISEYLGKHHNVNVIVENRTGGSTIPAVLALKNAAPDGYTVGWYSSSTVSTMPVVEEDLPYVQSDMQPVFMVYQGPIVLAVSNDVPASDAAEYIEYVRQTGAPGLVGATANGGAGHLTAVGLGIEAGTDVELIAYRGGPPMTMELVSNLLPASMDIMDTFLPLHNDGKLKIIGHTGDERIAVLPDVKTFAEVGYEDVKGRFWHGIFVPEGTPADVADKLNSLFSDAMAAPEIRNRLTADLQASPNTAAEFAQIIDDDTNYWASVAKEAGL